MSIRLKVFRDAAEVATLSIEGDKDKPDDLAAKLVAEVEQRIPQPK